MKLFKTGIILLIQVNKQFEWVTWIPAAVWTTIDICACTLPRVENSCHWKSAVTEVKRIWKLIWWNWLQTRNPHLLQFWFSWVCNSLILMRSQFLSFHKMTLASAPHFFTDLIIMKFTLTLTNFWWSTHDSSIDGVDRELVIMCAVCAMPYVVFWRVYIKCSFCLWQYRV